METSTKSLALPVTDEPRRVWLRSANAGDLANLRHWKNQRREFFFHKEEISAEQQEKWFRAYQARPHDFMFMVMVGGDPAGCMGIRLVDNHTWDVYNVILGVHELRVGGPMRSAFQAMLRFATSHHPAPITLKVLKGNPAIDWYRKNGFVISAEHPDHFAMSYRPLQCHHDNP
jgi:hypothetical protein